MNDLYAEGPAEGKPSFKSDAKEVTNLWAEPIERLTDNVVPIRKRLTLPGDLAEQCRQGGIGADILIPLRPWDQPSKHLKGKGKTDAGKTPAFAGPGPKDDCFINLGKWRDGLPADRLHHALSYGANLGLILGKLTWDPNNPNNQYSYVCADLDPEAGQEGRMEMFAHALVASMRDAGTIMVRHSRPGSLALLFRIKDQDAGRKTVFHIHFGDVYVGKVEILATGQQVCIAGRHQTNVQITWRHGIEEITVPLDIGAPMFNTFSDLLDAIGKGIEASHYTYEFRKAGYYPGTELEVKDRIPETLTVEDVEQLLQVTPNRKETDRDDYVSMGLHAGSVLEALAKNNKNETQHIQHQVALAFGKWASSWDGPKPGTQFEEFEKFQSDFAVHGHVGTWLTLLQHAEKLGADISGWLERDKAWLEENARLLAAERALKDFSFEMVPDELPSDPEERDDVIDRINKAQQKAAEDRLATLAPWPNRFRLKPGKGLYATVLEGRGEKAAEVERFVCAPLEFLGVGADEKGSGHSVVIRFDAGGRSVTLPVSQADAHMNDRSIAALLQAHGLTCNPNQRKALNEFFVSVFKNRAIKMVLVDRCGWHEVDGQRSFLLPTGETFGPAKGRLILRNDHRTGSLAFRVRGTLEEWQTDVAVYAVGNSRLMLCMCASFAAPLMDLFGAESGGFHQFGDSSTGKTTGLRMGATVWGSGSERDAHIETWRTTANGLEARAASLCDLPMPCDETGQGLAKDIAAGIYSLANGMGKTRMTVTIGQKRSLSWRVLPMSTGEHSIAQTLKDAGMSVPAGIDVRMVDIPADAGKGMGVFEALHGRASVAELANYLRGAVVVSYGTAGPAFLQRLITEITENEKALTALLKGYGDEFDKVIPQGADGQVRRVAARFRMIACAGELATSWDITGWPAGAARRGVETCFKAWLARRGTVGSMERHRGVEQVRHILAKHGESRFTSLCDPSENGELEPEDGVKATNVPIASGGRTHDRLGYRQIIKDEKGEHTEYMIFPDEWRHFMCKGFDEKEVGRELAKLGFLEKDHEGKSSTRRIIPRVGRIRVYVVDGRILETE